MSRPLSPLPRRYWAKGARAGVAQGESLAYHTAAVAQRLSQFALRAPALGEIAEDPRLWHRAFWACWLHDLGKAARAFQRYLRGERGSWDHRHEVLSLAFLPWVAPPDDADFVWIAAAIASHHRDAPVIVGQRYALDVPVGDLDLDAMVAELEDEAILGVAHWLRERAPQWVGGTVLSKLGVRTETRIASQVDPARFRAEAPGAVLAALRAYDALWKSQRAGAVAGRRQGVLLRGLVLLSDRVASAHAPALEDLAVPDADELFRRIGAPADRLRPHQEAAARTCGSLVLVAPTGSGKTEAALLWAGRQLAEPGPARRLIYLLPYQASLNAMRSRLISALGTEVGLLHGRSAQVLYRELADHGYTGREAERAARRADDLARLHHPAVWVATPYQLLRAAYRLPGYESIWASLAGALIVIDEPHAYEPRRLGLLLGLLGELVRNWRVRVCAMTATLPSWLGDLLVESLSATELPIDRELFAAFRRHRLALVPGEIDEAQNVDQIAATVAEGRSVLVGVNTVRRAQRVRALLAARLGRERVRLLHSRFSGRDRARKEQEIMERLRAGADAAGALAVVATQVIEVSLDLDFDTIYSEPAPLEALAQRFGRVNRRGKKGVVPVHVCTEPTDGQHIYARRLVERTMLELGLIDGQVLDEALLADHLDAIYADGLDDEFAAEASRSRVEFEKVCIQPLRAFESDDSLEQAFDQLFEGTEVLPASLVAEYRALAERRSVLEAQTLLVPLNDRQRFRLGDAAQWDAAMHVWIVDVPYDPESGLQLGSRPDADGE